MKGQFESFQMDGGCKYRIGHSQVPDRGGLCLSQWSGDWPVWKSGVKNETRPDVWDQIMGVLEWPTALWCSSFGSWESQDFCPEEQKTQKGDDLRK